MYKYIYTQLTRKKNCLFLCFSSLFQARLDSQQQKFLPMQGQTRGFKQKKKKDIEKKRDINGGRGGESNSNDLPRPRDA